MNSVTANLILVLLAGVVLASCASQPKYPMDEFGNILATEIVYDEHERGPDQKNFITRIVIVDDKVRISDSRNWKDFILMDRKNKIIYSVNNDDKTIFVIKAQAVNVKPPIDIKFEVAAQPSSALPKVNKQKATHYRFTANGEHCYDSISLGKEVYPEIATALGEFKTIMAGEHAKTLGSIPKDQLDACDLAINVFYPVKYLENGFPLREWDRHGYLRFIRYYRKNGKVKPEELELPEGFERYSIDKS